MAEDTNRLVAVRRLVSADKTGRVITALDATLEAGEPLTIAALALRFQGRLRPGQAQVSAQRAGAVLAAEQSPPLQHRNHIVHKILNAPCRVGGIRLKPSAPTCSNQRVISSAICSGVPTMVQCPPPAAVRQSPQQLAHGGLLGGDDPQDGGVPALGPGEFLQRRQCRHRAAGS